MPLAIVEDLNAFHNLTYGLLRGSEAAMVNEFIFQHRPEALDRGIVNAVASAVHCCLHVELL